MLKKNIAYYFLICIFSFALAGFAWKKSGAVVDLPLSLQLQRVEKIYGREPEKIPLYHIAIPPGWLLVLPSFDDPLDDTRKPLCTLMIEDIRLTIHNFPVNTLEERIPPQGQIARWKQQLEELDETTCRIEPISFNGFQGLFFQGSGIIEGENVAVLGWSLQLGKEHFRTLSHPKFPIQSRADVTIKAVGPEELIQQYRNEIYTFAKTFSLIEEIPPPR